MTDDLPNEGMRVAAARWQDAYELSGALGVETGDLHWHELIERVRALAAPAETEARRRRLGGLDAPEPDGTEDQWPDTFAGLAEAAHGLIANVDGSTQGWTQDDDWVEAADRWCARYDRVVASPAETEAGGLDPHLLGEALDYAWTQWIGDVGHVPDAFHLHPRTARCSATFEGSEFARHAAGRYDHLARLAATPGDDRGRELAERDDERRWDIGNALGWELEDESPSWVEIMRGIADLRALAVPAPQITRQADVDPDILAMARRHLAEHDTVDLLARKCLRLIDPMCPSLADKGDSAGMYRDLARRAIRQALASESQAEGAGETADGKQ